MKITDSKILLADYSTNGSDAAFRELVTRYCDLVYSTALRWVSDAHLAQDVAQMVFVDLARQARSLPENIVLGGWLHRHTCFLAGKVLRGQRRRLAREREAVEMNVLNDSSDEKLAQFGPVLDEAINKLGAADRTAILLRFFEHRDFRSVGQALGSNEDTAQKRVSRALEKLHSNLQRRGVTLSVTALGTALAAQAVTAAPQGLAAVIGGASLACEATGGGISLSILKIITMTKLKLGVAGVLVVAGLAIPLIIRHGSDATPFEESVATVQTQSSDGPGESLPNNFADTKENSASQGTTSVQNPPASPAVLRPLDEILKGQRLSPEQAQALESKLTQDAEDISARCQLIGHYWVARSQAARESRQGHILWFVQHHPEINLIAYGGLNPILDREAYYQTKALWVQQANDNPQYVDILGNAAQFLLVHDRPVAEELLKQAQSLQPANPEWSIRLAELYSLDTRSAAPGAANPSSVNALAQMENAQANTTERKQRFLNLNKLTQMAFNAGQMEKAQTYAVALLEETAHPQLGWDYGDAIHQGNLALGRIALRNGRVEDAKQYLLASGKTAGSPVLGSFGPNMSLAKEMLEQGQKETVIEFFGLCTRFWKNDKLLTWAQQADQGTVPDFGANLRY